MDPAFWYKLGLSLLVGGVWIALTTVAAERFGSKTGGLIGGLPSTALVGLLFIGVTQSAHIAAQATTIMPLAQGFNGLFIVVFVRLVRRGLLPGMGCALIVWFLSATLLVHLGVSDLRVSVAGWILLTVGCYLAVEKWMAIPSHQRLPVTHTTAQVLLRAIFGGAVIAAAVLVGKLGGPIYGGVFATFPAMFVSTLIITHRAGGAAFSTAVAKALMVSGLINVGVFALAARYAYQLWGLGFGTAAALLVSCCSGYLTLRFMRRGLA